MTPCLKSSSEHRNSAGGIGMGDSRTNTMVQLSHWKQHRVIVWRRESLVQKGNGGHSILWNREWCQGGILLRGMY